MKISWQENKALPYLLGLLLLVSGMKISDVMYYHRIVTLEERVLEWEYEAIEAWTVTTSTIQILQFYREECLRKQNVDVCAISMRTLQMNLWQIMTERMMDELKGEVPNDSLQDLRRPESVDGRTRIQAFRNDGRITKSAGAVRASNRGYFRT